MSSKIPNEADVDGTPIAPSAPDEVGNKLIDMPEGGDLTPETGAAITARTMTRLVFVAGEFESGKTTLLTAIYEKLNKAPFAGFLFAGSATLVGWEKKCHLARVASGAEKADTERTLGLEQRLLHLRLRKADLSEVAQDVLFTDLSGEAFKLVRDSTAECQRIGMMKRADHFVLLVDGNKLSAIETRLEALANPVALLRSCLDGGMIGARSFVDVVFSKCDLLSAGQPGTSEFVEHAISVVRERFQLKVGRLRIHKIAARPEGQEFEPAFGISDLLQSWVQDSPQMTAPVPVLIELRPESSEFDRYLIARTPYLVAGCQPQ